MTESTCNNLAECYLSDPNRITALKAIPRRQLAASEMPLLTAVHLRAEDIAAAPASFSSQVAPAQSIATLLAISSLLMNGVSNSSNSSGSSENNNNNVISIQEASENGGNSDGKQKRSNRPCTAHASSTDPKKYKSGSSVDHDVLFLSSTADRKKVRTIVKLDPLTCVLSAEATTTSSGAEGTTTEQEQQQQKQQQQKRRRCADLLSQRWTNNVARKHFLRNSNSSVASFVEIWVVVPFDTVLQRLMMAPSLSTLSDDHDHDDEDFVTFAVNSRPELRHRILSHLFGECSQLAPATSMLVFSCKLVPHVLAAASQANANAGAVAAVPAPAIVEALGAQTEWLAARRWIENCKVELAAEMPFWIYAPKKPPASSVAAAPTAAPVRRSRAADDDTAASGANSLLAPPTPTSATTAVTKLSAATASSSTAAINKTAVTTCLQCRYELLQRLSYDYCPFGVAWVLLPTLLLFGLGARWIDRGRSCDAQARQWLIPASSSNSFSNAVALCVKAMSLLQNEISSVNPTVKREMGEDDDASKSECSSCQRAFVSFLVAVISAGTRNDEAQQQQQPLLRLTMHLCSETATFDWIIEMAKNSTNSSSDNGNGTVAEGRKVRQRVPQFALVVTVSIIPDQLPSVILEFGGQRFHVRAVI